MTVPFDCPCGRTFDVPLSTTTEDRGDVLHVTLAINEAAMEAQWEWHRRRFHGGHDDLPERIAA